MKNSFTKISQLLLAATLVAAFQNCSFTIDPFSKIGVAKANGNGTGYDGKAYASYGKCSVGDVVTLKSLIIRNADGTLVQTVDECLPLAEPIAIDMAKLQRPIVDKSLFVYEKGVFDEVRPTVEETKLTRVVCWGRGKKVVTESAIFFAPGSLSPRASRVLSGYMLNSSGQGSGLISPIDEMTSRNDGAVFEGSDDSGTTLKIDYSAAGSSTLDCYDSNDSYRRTSLAVGCFEQRRPEKVLTLQDL